MKNKCFLMALLIGIGVLYSCSVSQNNKVKKIAIISLIEHPIFNTIQQSFKEELQNQLKNKVDYQLIENNAQGNIDNLPNIANQVVGMNPDVVVPISTPVTQSVLRSANINTKVVYTFVSDTLNLMDALQKTNTTGLSDVINYKDNIMLIKSIMGAKVKIGVIYNPNEANSVKGINEIKDISNKYNITIIYATVRNESEIAIVADQIIKRSDAILSIGDNTVGAGLRIVIDNAMLQHKPVFAIEEGSIKDLGAIGGVSVDYRLLGRETARIVAEIIANNMQPKNIKKILLYGNKLLFNKKALNKLNIQLADSLKKKGEFVE